MEVSIIRVGNSRGLRLPKSIIDEYQIENTVELKLKDGYIELRPVSKPRSGWESKLEELANDPNEEDMIDDFFEDEDL